MFGLTFLLLFDYILGEGRILGKLLELYDSDLSRIKGRHDLERLAWKKVNNANLFTKFNS